LSPQDQRQLATARGIRELILRQQQVPGAQPTPAAVRQLARELAPLLPQLLPGVAATGRLFARELGQRAYGRVAAVLRRGRDEYSVLD
jgi:hypothetical protein